MHYQQSADDSMGRYSEMQLRMAQRYLGASEFAVAQVMTEVISTALHHVEQKLQLAHKELMLSPQASAPSMKAPRGR